RRAFGPEERPESADPAGDRPGDDEPGEECETDRPPRPGVGRERDEQEEREGDHPPRAEQEQCGDGVLVGPEVEGGPQPEYEGEVRDRGAGRPPADGRVLGAFGHSGGTTGPGSGHVNSRTTREAG